MLVSTCVLTHFFARCKLCPDLTDHVTYIYHSAHRDEDRQLVSDIGCTAEIFSMKDEMDEASGISMVRVKARGRQRFKVIDTKSEITG